MVSLHISGAERLANGNTLICEGESGRLLEVTREGNICWEWISPFVYDFKGSQAAQIFRAHRYAGGSPELKNRTLDGSGLETLNRQWKLDQSEK
jgi:hypothetical protein